MSFLHNSSIAFGLVLGCSVIAPSLLHAQDWNAASSLYGQGVHAYFAGRSADAESYLSRALAIETQDPRLYYFRALSLMRLGRMNDARGDMMVGADLEARQPNRFAVGTALQRVQGADRLLLERFRRQGRTDAAANRQRMRNELYPTTFDQESQVLRQRIVIPLDRFMQPGGPQPLSAEELAERPPALPQTGTTSPRAASGRTSTAKPAGDDPFRDDPQQRAGAQPVVEPRPDESAPGESTAEEEAAPETEPMPEAEDDPFSGF